MESPPFRFFIARSSAITSATAPSTFSVDFSLLNHIDSYIKNNGCLLAVAGAGVYLGLPFIVVGQHIQRDGRAQFTLALLFRDFNIGRGVLAHGGIVISNRTEHVPDDFLLPWQQFEADAISFIIGRHSFQIDAEYSRRGSNSAGDCFRRP